MAYYLLWRKNQTCMQMHTVHVAIIAIRLITID